MFSAWVVWLIIFGGTVAVGLGIYAAIKINHQEDKQHHPLVPGPGPGNTRADMNEGKGGHAW